MKPFLSIISPVYKAEDSIIPLIKAIIQNVEPLTLDFEIILVEDGSPDLSWEKIMLSCLEDDRVKGIKLSRNFGQHYAISAGLEAASGDKIIVMDCDLQDDPIYIPLLLAKSEEGFDIVYTYKTKRRHSAIKNFISNIYYYIFNFLIENKNNTADKNIGSYSLLSRKVVDSILKINDYHRHYLMVLRWLGFNFVYMEIEHRSRPFGKSSYNFRKLLTHAINGITSQSNRLLYFSIGIGLFIFSASFIGIIILIINYFIRGYQQGWASLIVVMLMSTGLIMLSLGITGIYIGKIFEQVKNRPLYLIDKKINF